jgi:hemoglobin
VQIFGSLIIRATMMAGLLFATAVVTVGCVRTVEPTEPTTFFAHPPLYDRLGGLPGIEGLVELFVNKVGNDSRIKERFANADLVRFKKLLVDQICDLGDGPCQYRGRDMKTVHAGMKVTTAEFHAMLEDLAAAMDAYKVPKQERLELLTLLKSMREDIVEVR